MKTKKVICENEGGDEMNMKMPIGIDDFAEARENCYLVDKTGFLSKFLPQHAKVTLFARPRRFGKTLTLSMMRYFLDIEGAQEHRKLFEGLRVAEDAATMAWQGTRPVLFLTLKDWKGKSWEAMLENIRFLLGNLFSERDFLLKDDMKERDCRNFQAILDGTAGEPLLRDGLAFLLRLFSVHYGRKAVLLLDEYDAPIQEAWANGFYNDAIDFFRTFFSRAIKTNETLDFAVLTGVLRASKESIFSGLNNLAISSVISGSYADAFGFTKQDVQKMASNLGRMDCLEEIASWYDGYDFQGVEIYNPWSVINYFQYDCRAEAYWINTSGNHILQEMLQNVDDRREREMAGLMQGKSVQTGLNETFVYSDMGENKDDLYTLLLFAGYLKCVAVHKDEEGDAVYELAIPNREIRSVYRHEILRNLSGMAGQSILREMMQAIVQGNAKRFQEDLQKILLDMASVHDTAKPEAFYHGLMLGMTVWLARKYRMESNQESGYGKFDLAFFPQAARLPGILMEFKSAGKIGQMKKAAEAACRQVEERNYAERLRVEGVSQIWCYGIAFCGKRVELQMCVLD